MSKLGRQLAEDRALRNAARSIVFDQLLRVRESASGKSIGTQLADTVGDDALDLAGRAETAARSNGGLIAAIAGVVGTALALWFAREPIAALINRDAEPSDREPQPAEAPEASDGSEELS